MKTHKAKGNNCTPAWDQGIWGGWRLDTERDLLVLDEHGYDVPLHLCRGSALQLAWAVRHTGEQEWLTPVLWEDFHAAMWHIFGSEQCGRPFNWYAPWFP